jgi:hypothetical protein
MPYLISEEDASSSPFFNRLNGSARFSQFYLSFLTTSVQMDRV